MMNEHWKKSTYSNGEGGNCVEARTIDQGAAVRDTQNRAQAELNLPAHEWNALLSVLTR